MAAKSHFARAARTKRRSGYRAIAAPMKMIPKTREWWLANFIRHRSRRKPAGVRIGGTPPQFEALQLAGLGPRQFGDILDGTGIFIGRDRCLDEILQGPRQRCISAKSLFQYHVGFHDLA